MVTSSNEGERAGKLGNVLRVFISSQTEEMKAYRERAKAAIRDASMTYIAYDDPDGITHTQGDKSLMALGFDTVTACDVLVGLYGLSAVWAPGTDRRVVDESSSQFPTLVEDPYRPIVEYEYSWARQAGLYLFPFLRTPRTTQVPYVVPDPRIEEFTEKLRARTVGWLSTPDALYDKLRAGLEGIRPRVFLSYSRNNRDAVRELQRQLRNEDIHAWRDESDIAGGDEWRVALDQALARMDVMVVVVTRESLASEWVEKEAKEFVEQGKTVVPLLFDPACRDALPDYLADRQFIDGTADGGVQGLAKRLRALLES